MAEGQSSPETATEEEVTSPEAKEPKSQNEFEIVEWFKNKIKESCVTFVVYYRGYW